VCWQKERAHSIESALHEAMTYTRSYINKVIAIGMLG